MMLSRSHENISEVSNEIMIFKWYKIMRLLVNEQKNDNE